MESGIANRLNNLCVLYCNLEKKFNDYLLKNEVDSTTKEEIEKIKEELREIKKENESLKKEDKEDKEDKEEIKKEIKKENESLLKGELEIINGELKIIKNNNNSTIKDELDSITHELRYQKNVNLETPNYLEYTLLYADFQNCGICMYCPSEPYEPENDISSGPIIDNAIYTNLKNILNN